MSNKSKARHKANNHKPNYKRKPDTHKPDTLKPDTVKTDKPDTHKPDSTLVRTIEHGEQDKVKLVDDKTGKLIPTKQDKAKIERVKKAQSAYRKAKLEAQEALRKVKLEYEALDGSEALKALKAELEAKLEAKQTEVTEARDTFKALVDEYNSLSIEYQDLTGISKKALKVNGKVTGTAHLSGDGNWIPTVTANGKDSVRVVVKYKPTNTIFEDTLYAEGNGLISHKHWLELRERFYQFDGANPDKPKSVFFDLYQTLDNSAKANFRAFLYPRLYNVISKVKGIADKIA